MKNILTKLKEKIKGLSKVTIALVVTLMCVCTFGIVKATVTMDYDNNQMTYQTGDTQELPVPVWGGKTSPYRDKVLSVNTLYDVGEANLTDDDIVQVNGVDCYVLQVDSANNKAELITKGIYDQRFDSTCSTYKYHESPLKTWMDNFYTNQLGDDEYILESNVTSYYKGSYSTDLTTFSTESISQHVFALDAIEAETNKSKFSWDIHNGFIDNSASACGFWVSAACYIYGSPSALSVNDSGGFVNNGVEVNLCGARPAFWIDISGGPQMEFAGWWTKDGSSSGDWGTQVTTISATDMGDMDLYAKWDKAIEYLSLGGKVFLDNGDNGATYTFYDTDKNEITYTDLSSLDNAVYYSVDGTPTTDRFYIVASDSSQADYNSDYGVNLGTSKYWGYYNIVTGATTNTIGSGKTNTATVLAIEDTWHSANISSYPNQTIWEWLNDVNTNEYGGCNDWFIGSLSEHNALKSSGKAGSLFSFKSLWSSVDYSSSRAYYWGYNNGGWNNTFKRSTYLVVAFRAF